MAFTFFLLHTLLLTIRMLLGKVPRRSGYRNLDRTARRSFDTSPRSQRDHPSLHALPPENLEKIFRSACTDGGRTGCSLSLVSKRVRAVSTAARYHSISLLVGSPRKLRRFIECFERARGAARVTVEGSATPRIHHLCLALYPTTPTRLLCRPGEKVLELHEWLDTVSAVQYGDEGWTRYRQHALNEYYAVVQTLFHMVSGDLRSMCLFGRTEWWEDGFTMPAIACSGFPMLTELSISGDEPRFALLERTYPLDTPFPVLARLHIVADAHQNVDFQRWVNQTPKLESMRISCCGNVYTPGWITSFQQAIDTLSETRIEPPRTTLLIKPAYLTRLVGLHHLYHVATVRMLERLQQTKVPLVFVPYYIHQDLCRGPASPAMEPEQLMRLDWLARVDGPQGLFMDDFWTRYKGGRIMDKIYTWWLFGEHYLKPLVHI